MERIEVPKEMIKKLMDGVLSDQEVLMLQNSYKDHDRFFKYLEVLQERVPWDDKILMRLSEHVYVVQKKDTGERISKCTCGYEFGDYRVNWKLNCLINVRKTIEEMSEVYHPIPACPEPEWQEIREFFCPGCGTQLAVEVVPPGYPILFEFLPDLDSFYKEWLHSPLPDHGKYRFEDKSLTLIEKWSKEV